MTRLSAKTPWKRAGDDRSVRSGTGRASSRRPSESDASRIAAKLLAPIARAWVIIFSRKRDRRRSVSKSARLRSSARMWRLT